MNFRNNFTKIGFFTLSCLLIGGSIIYQTAYSQDAEQAKKESAAPVTKCFESMEGYTSVSRIENAVPQYGYPNVKCSQTTSGVLWYGDPYDGTKPMGDMPKLKDDTRGDYDSEEAVVKPRESKLNYFECTGCHDGDTVPVPKDKKARAIDAHDDIVENPLEMMHGRGAIWCLDCHSATNRNKLVDHQGNEISMDQPQKLCGSCHGEVYADWRMGIHGKRTGSWVKGGKKRWWVCTECHNPHTVEVNRFDPLKPEQAPELPRGMKKTEHNTEEH
ncbi:MAG: cytochrome c3 family protein [Thermodesulfovibrionia bacterium]|nr:cytochrome c3 family protein [Thermodesulfovibrionia bacterium]